MDLELHFVKENVVLTKRSRATDKLMHGIKVLIAKNYIDNLSEEVKKGLRTKASQNLWPSYAPLGYTNAAGEDGKRIIVPDPILGPQVTNLFHWFANETYSLKALARKACDEGFRFRKRPGEGAGDDPTQDPTEKDLYRGVRLWRHQVPRSHQPLVTKEVWQCVQEILEGGTRKSAGTSSTILLLPV